MSDTKKVRDLTLLSAVQHARRSAIQSVVEHEGIGEAEVVLIDIRVWRILENAADREVQIVQDEAKR